MKLFRLEPSDPSYPAGFGREDIRAFDIYTRQGDRLGQATGVLVDEQQRRYLAVATSSWINNQHVLLPLEGAQLNPNSRRIYVENLSKAQLERLPAYDPTAIASRRTDYPLSGLEHTHAAPIQTMALLEASAPLETSAPLDIPHFIQPQSSIASLGEKPMPAHDTDSEFPSSINLPNDSTPRAGGQETVGVPAAAAPAANSPPFEIPAKPMQEETIRLLEERLHVNRHKRKVGEVIVRKVVETQIVEVPVRREKLIVEQTSPELKQLAAIDLGQAEISRVDLTGRGSPQLTPAAQPAPADAFIPAEAASQVLREVVGKPGYQNVRIKLAFADAELQSIYEQWLERYLGGANR